MRNFFGIALLLSALVIPPLFAQASDSSSTEQPASQYIITDIQVKGLVRTKPYIVNEVLQKYKGRDSRSLDLNAVYADVESLGVVNPEKVETVPNGTGQTLVVTVYDKWAFILAPFFMMNSGGSIQGGLGFMDMNLFGIADNMMLVAMWRADYNKIKSTSSIMTMANYNHNTRDSRFPHWGLSFSYSHGWDNRLMDQKNKTIYEWKTDSVNAGGSLQYQFLDKRLSTALGLSFSSRKIRDADAGISEGNDMHIAISPNAGWHQSSYDGYLMSQKSIALGYTANIAIGESYNDSDKIEQHISFGGQYETPVVPGFKLTAALACLYTPEQNILSAQHPALAMLPGDYLAWHYYGLSAGLEKYIYKWKIGVLSFLFNYQTIETYAPVLGWQFDQGLGAGLVFYLSRIAIPAVSVSANYNISRKYFSMGFALGGHL